MESGCANLLCAVNDKIATNIQGTFLVPVHLVGGGFLLVQHAVLGAKHDGDAAKTHLLHELFFLQRGSELFDNTTSWGSIKPERRRWQRT